MNGDNAYGRDDHGVVGVLDTGEVGISGCWMMGSPTAEACFQVLLSQFVHLSGAEGQAGSGSKSI